MFWGLGFSVWVSGFRLMVPVLRRLAMTGRQDLSDLCRKCRLTVVFVWKHSGVCNRQRVEFRLLIDTTAESGACALRSVS